MKRIWMGEYVKGSSSDWIEGAEHKESIGGAESKYCPVLGNYHKRLQNTIDTGESKKQLLSR